MFGWWILFVVGGVLVILVFCICCGLFEIESYIKVKMDLVLKLSGW